MISSKLMRKGREASGNWTIAASYEHCVVLSKHNLEYVALYYVSQLVRLTRNNLKLIESN